MAVVTIIAAAYMGRVLAGCDNAIVTRATGANDLSVVDGDGRHKSYRAVAIFADTGRLYVNRALARRSQSVMA